MSCSLCNGSGKIPFKRDDGSIVPHAFEYCECYHPEVHEHETRPEDIDYTVSSLYYSCLCQLHGWHDPTLDYLPEPVEPVPQVSSRINFTSSMRKQEFDLLQQTALKADWLEKKYIELEAKKKKQVYEPF